MGDVTNGSTSDRKSAVPEGTKDLPLYERIALEKRANRERSIPEEWRLPKGHVPEDQLNVTDVPMHCGILTEKECEITELAAAELVERIQSRELSSYEVTLAFCKRAAIAQQLVNCLSEIFFEKALQTAAALDAEYAVSGIAAGPLHGLPVSLKDCFQVEGTDASIGFTAFSNEPALEHEESEITKIMRQNGAVLFCKTNVPLGLMAGETYNAIYGYTSNPYNRSLSSGGSSGGESALLALKGAPLGVGTDVGGSIRIPASFCGLYSLKPSFGRFPTFGLRDGLNGQEAVRNTVGPMARSVRDIQLWSKTVIKSEPWMTSDPDCLPIPWRELRIPDKLCFGIWLDDGIVKPLPPVTRAVLKTKAALEAAGHSVIEFQVDDPLYLDTLKFDLYRSATAEALDKNLAKTPEPWPRGCEMLQAMVQGNTKASTVYYLWNAQAKRTEYSFTYDNYTSLWNVLDYCATTVPVSYVSLHEDATPSYESRNDSERCVWKNYSPGTFAEAPVAVQLVGRRLNEEYLLGVTQKCDEALKMSMSYRGY
ncbi:hypothetical protein N7468_002172 [Penicillium chermesinum]|uniref:amidase n=1 Tax=Penicillium chermesinum TaxID=63820 RepID=A0A9W9PI02_9EURO|nr:uncharacterized protein N7468_002172 [Penicillium chermesinum]KAJ5247189.1 hypothetical protein N7468_002172 [Penicillium chermesinum]